jgi:hypothetical protein
MTDKNLYLATTSDGRTIDLTKAKALKGNNLYPFGPHNFAIYQTLDNEFVKATNRGEREIMLNYYEVIPEAEAVNYKHPYIREDEVEAMD